MAKGHGKLHTTSKHHGSFTHNHGAHKGSGHSGLIHHGAGKSSKGNFMVSTSNVKALGSKGKG